MNHWANESVFYHIYPLGFCGAPLRNDFTSPVTPRLELLYRWIPHLQNMGVNALYLGPVFESSTHGYDTADYYRLDRRLGSNQTLIKIVSRLHEQGTHVILDGVFNHVGRDFWAFRDVIEHGQQSAYCDWFQGLSFEKQSPYHDPFTYDCWSGHYNLVKLNLKNKDVKHHLLQAVEMWIREFEIDGLRLDVADALAPGFLKDLAAFSRRIRADFWLMGEVIHGDYRNWVNSEMLDSVTNYECYKGLYSSHVDKNYFEIAYALERQFGSTGLYRQAPLYNFADNHDVNRVASSLKTLAHLYPLYCILFTMPGVPSIYYGSEWGIRGKRESGDDNPLRPCLDLAALSQSSPQPDLALLLGRLSQIRRNSQALKYGDYLQLFVSHEQFAFARRAPEEWVVVLVNASQASVSFEFDLPMNGGRRLIDLLSPEESFSFIGNRVKIESVPANWARILVVE